MTIETMKEENVVSTIKEMIASGESACFIGQVLKLCFLGAEFTPTHFYEGGATLEQTKHRFQKALKYKKMLDEND